MEVICGAKHLWFLLCLFDLMVIIAIVMPVIAKTGKWADFWILLGVIILEIFNHFVGSYNVLGIQSAVHYLPIFLIGFYTAKYQIDRYLIRMVPVKFYGLLTVVITAMVIVILSRVMPFGTLYMNIPTYLGLPLIFAFVSRIVPVSGSSLLICSLDKNSLGIYILHQFVGKYSLMHYVPGFVEFYDRHCILAPICLFVFMLFMAWMVSAMLHKHKIGAALLGSQVKPNVKLQNSV